MPERILLLKGSSASGAGGSYPTTINPQNDMLEAFGLYLQSASNRDETVYLTRTGSNVSITGGISQSGGSFSLTGNSASSINVTSGNISINTSSGNGSIAISSGTGIVSIGDSTNITLTPSSSLIEIGKSSTTNSIYIGDTTVGSSQTQSVRIATAASGTGLTSVLIGSNNGASTLSLNSGSGNILINSTTGAINIGNTASARSINIGTGAAVQAVTIGSTNGTSSLILDSGTGNIAIGTSVSSKTIQIGPPSTAANTTITSEVNIGFIPSSTLSTTKVTIGTGGAGVTSNIIKIGNYTSGSTNTTSIWGNDIDIGYDQTNSGTVRITGSISGAASAAVVKVAIGSSSASVDSKLYVRTDAASNYAAHFANDGANSNRWGIKIQCGSAAGTATWIDFIESDSGVSGSITSTNGAISYGAFTGHHNAIVNNQLVEKTYGMIVKLINSVTEPEKRSIYYIVEPTSTMKDSAVFGIYSSDYESPSDPKLINKSFIFCLGDGHVLVTDQGGNINIGDYICSSDVVGHGMKQDDNILRNYTVAKATEAVDFSNVPIDPVRGYKSVLITCTYHSA